MKKKKNVLIIGSEGYIGSAIKNYNYIDNLTTLDISGNPDIKINYGELKKEDINNFDTVILLAANSGVAQSGSNYIYSFENNISNFLNLLSILNKDQKLIYASTGSIYGKTDGLIVNEEYAIFNPINYYDLTKYVGDCYAKLSNINFYGLRFGTVNGITKNSNIVRDDLIINAMVKNAILKKEIECTNPFVYRGILGINDLVRAISAIIESEDNKSGIYNLSSFNVSVGEVANKVSKVIECNIISKNTDYITYDFKMDASKFSKVFNFSFEETLDSIIEDLYSKFDMCEFIRRLECLKI